MSLKKCVECKEIHHEGAEADHLCFHVRAQLFLKLNLSKFQILIKYF